jgi:hypothetical protein
VNRLGDFVLFTEDKRFPERMEAIRDAYVRCADWIPAHCEKDRTSLALRALLVRAIPFIEKSMSAPTSELPEIALAARYLFESDLRAEHIIASTDNLSQWESEALADGIDVIDGFLRLHLDAPNVNIRSFEDARIRLVELASKHTLKHNTRYLSVSDLAKAVGRKDDYDAFFKIYSKLLHPSSYFVNGLVDAWGGFLRDTLVATLQGSAIALIERTRSALEIPDHVTLPKTLPDD